MTDLQTHINIFKELYIPSKVAVIRMLWDFIEDHKNEISKEDFIKAISQKTTTDVVQPLR